ncbi:MAG TPA: tetratricopeptide repeat protein [Polyangiaceae bacterium]|nr:tetratricopeptide repeat protein [Polyangiaceae bacterium]
MNLVRRVILIASLSLGLAACGTQPRAEQRAAMLAEKGRLEEAEAVLRKHLESHPNDHAAHRQLIRTLALTGRLDRVRAEIAVLEQRVGPTDPSPLIELGHALELAHQYDEALEAYDRASARAPKDPLGPRTGGMRAARWGEAKLAKPRLEEALRRDPRDAKLWHALGLVRLRLGDVKGAKQAYRSGLTSDPAALDNRIGLATAALMERDDEAALAQYAAILRARPRFADAHLGRAYALLRLGRLDEAEAAILAAEKGGAAPGVIRRQRSLLARLKTRRQAPEEQKNR